MKQLCIVNLLCNLPSTVLKGPNPGGNAKFSAKRNRAWQVSTLLMLQADQYAPETEVHKYLHSRLASFDIATLYELHYQMITLGKVGLSPLTAATPLSCPSTFLVHAHFVRAYGVQLEYALAVSIDTHIHTRTYACTHARTNRAACPGSPPPLGYQ